MGDGIIGLPGAEFDLSVLKVELDVITVVEFVTAGRTNIELEVLTPVPVPQPPVKIIIKRSCLSKIFFSMHSNIFEHIQYIFLIYF